MKKQTNIQLPFTRNMFLTLQVEEVAITATAVYFLTLHGLGISVWLWIPLFLSPDIFMLGYLFSTRLGAIVYNTVHHRATGLLIAALGLIFHQEIMITLGTLFFAHSSFDRMLGYGLKYTDSFHHTSLGKPAI
jgi:hypothetical protein